MGSFSTKNKVDHYHHQLRCNYARDTFVHIDSVYIWKISSLGLEFKVKKGRMNEWTRRLVPAYRMRVMKKIAVDIFLFRLLIKQLQQGATNAGLKPYPQGHLDMNVEVSLGSDSGKQQETAIANVFIDPFIPRCYVFIWPPLDCSQVSSGSVNNELPRLSKTFIMKSFRSYRKRIAINLFLKVCNLEICAVLLLDQLSIVSGWIVLQSVDTYKST